MNFNTFLNQWGTQPASGLVDLIDSPTTTLARLLDQQQFVTDYKSGNSKVAEFMNYERFEQLLQFVTVVGPVEDKKRSYKYPLTASELLSMENTNAKSVELFLSERPILVQTKIIQDVDQEVEEQIEQPSENDTQQPKTYITEQENKIEQIEELKSKQAAGNGKVEEKDSSETEQETKAEKQQRQKGELASKKPVQNKANATKKTTKKVEKVIQQKKQPLIIKLLSYFSGEVNYTLAGYVSKILAFLLTKKPVEEKMIHQIIKHAESRSVGELIVKILTHESVYSLEQRQFFYKQLLARLSVPSEIYVISNLSAYVSEIIEKVAANLKSNNKIIQLSGCFFSLQIVTQVIKNVMSEQQSVSVYNAPILFTYLTNVPFAVPEDVAIIEEFKKLGELFIEKSCEKLQVEYRSKPRLVGGRIKLLQILRYVLKQNLPNAKQTVAGKRQFFPILLNLMKQYQMNNILHNQIIKILQIALSQPEGSSLNNSVLSQNLLVNFIRAETDEDKKIRAKDSVYKSRKGYIAHVINLAVRLRQLSEKNGKIKQLTQSSEFLSIYDSLIEKQTFNVRKSLAGFVKKEVKHQIMFQKEDIIAANQTFFQKCPPAVFQPEPKPDQPINTEHPDLLQELQKQLYQSLAVKSEQPTKQISPTIPISDKKTDEKKVQAEQIAQAQYWSTHLQYNVDDLINDL